MEAFQSGSRGHSPLGEHSHADPVGESQMDVGNNGGHNPTSRILRVPEILERTTLSRSCLYNQIELGLFPENIPLSDRARGQFEHLIDAWIGSRMALRSQMSRLRDPVTFPLWTPEMTLGEHPTGMRLLKLRTVEEKVGLKSSQIYRLIGEDLFSVPVPLTQNARRWLEHEVNEWLKGRVALSLKISGERTVRRSGDDAGRRDDDRPAP